MRRDGESKKENMNITLQFFSWGHLGKREKLSIPLHHQKSQPEKEVVEEIFLMDQKIVFVVFLKRGKKKKKKRESGWVVSHFSFEKRKWMALRVVLVGFFLEFAS